MALYDREYYREDEQTAFSSGNATMDWTTRLVIINAAVYLADIFYRGVMDRMALEASALAHPLQWWQFVTYGFAHDRSSINHILFNMLTLWFIGKPLEASMRSSFEYLLYYLIAVVFSGMVWALVHSGSANPLRIIGASGAVTAVVLLFILMNPKRPMMLMFIPMPAWAVGLIIIALNVLGANGAKVPGHPEHTAFDAHLAGAVFAVAYHFLHLDFGRWLPSMKGVDLRKWGRKNVNRPSLRVSYGDSDNALEETEDLDRQADSLLAKVHRDGEASLTARERRLLEDYSRRVRERKRHS